MTRLAQVILILVVAAYPLAVYFGIQYLSLGYVLAVLLAVAGLRLLLVPTQKQAAGGRLGAGALAAILAAVCAASWLRGDSAGLLWYPVLVNLVMLGIFAFSLTQPRSLIERLARLQEPDLPANGVRYTRRVTQVWCGFFIANGSIAAASALYGDLHLWTLYNGLLAYVLMGALLAGEWLVRKRVRTRTDEAA